MNRGSTNNLMTNSTQYQQRIEMNIQGIDKIAAGKEGSLECQA
jgi:hypothetical protein